MIICHSEHGHGNSGLRWRRNQNSFPVHPHPRSRRSATCQRHSFPRGFYRGFRGFHGKGFCILHSAFCILHSAFCIQNICVNLRPSAGNSGFRRASLQFCAFCAFLRQYNSKRPSMDHLHKETSYPGQARSSLVKPNYDPSASQEWLGFATFARFCGKSIETPVHEPFTHEIELFQSRPIKVNQGIFINQSAHHSITPVPWHSTEVFVFRGPKQRPI